MASPISEVWAISKPRSVTGRLAPEAISKMSTAVVIAVVVLMGTV